MAEPIGLAALALDATIGWPAPVYARIGHPVGLFARLIGWCETCWNRPTRSERSRLLLGILTLAGLVLVVGCVAFLIQYVAKLWFGCWAWIVIAALAAPGLAQRSLHDHVVPVARALEAGSLDEARGAVAMIVGRDTARLDVSGVARAAIESLAESFGDGVAAPFFWLLVAGLPGLWIYKAVNTADSLIGHREPRWRAFGWAAARTDDLLNLLPARIAGVLLCLAAPGGFATMVRDAGRHASPNAGWPEAAMAGGLGVRLGGPITYDGVLADKPWLGRAGRDAGAPDLRRALGCYHRACLLLWIVAGGVAWGL